MLITYCSIYNCISKVKICFKDLAQIALLLSYLLYTFSDFVFFINSMKSKLNSSMLGPNRVITKDFKSCTYCYNVICRTLIVRVKGMPWPQTSATPYYAHKGRAIKGLVVCYIIWLGSLIYAMGLWTSASTATPCIFIQKHITHYTYIKLNSEV